MESTVGSRIKELAQAKGYNMRAFSQASKISASAISAITAGKTNPSYEMTGKIAAAFPDVSMEWLLFGHGPMLKRPARSLMETSTPSLPEPQAAPATSESACWEILKREEAQHQLLKRDYEELKAMLRQARIDLFMLQNKDSGLYSTPPAA